MHVFGDFSSASQELEVRDGAATFDGEFDVVRWRVGVAGLNLDADIVESGIVGEIAPDGSDTFDSDVLVGVSGRWYFRPDLGLVAGYEFGKITTVNVGLRYSF